MSLTKFKIATSYDAELIASLSRQTFYDSFHADNTAENMQLFLDENFKPDIVNQEIEDDSNTFILAYTDSEIAGYVKLTESASPTELAGLRSLEISRIYVIKQQIGNGIGAALMQHCITIAEQRNKQSLWLGVWERNIRAISFYQRWGFTKFGTHIFMVGNDAQTDLLMKK